MIHFLFSQWNWSSGSSDPERLLFPPLHLVDLRKTTTTSVCLDWNIFSPCHVGKKFHCSQQCMLFLCCFFFFLICPAWNTGVSVKVRVSVTSEKSPCRTRDAHVPNWEGRQKPESASLVRWWRLGRSLKEQFCAAAGRRGDSSPEEHLPTIRCWSDHTQLEVD